jgi:hypothetical protein
MTRSPQSIRLILVLVISCFSSSLSYGQQLKIIGNPMSDAFSFASIIAENMNMNPPDSAGTISNMYFFRVNLSASDNSERWVIINFKMNVPSKVDEDKDKIYSISIIGEIPEIVELYARFYNPKLNKNKPEDSITAVEKDGQSCVLYTNYIREYKGMKKKCGCISISKSDSKK